MPTLTTPPPGRVGSPHAQDLVSCPSALSAASDAQQSAPSEQTFARVHAFTQLYTEQVGTVKGRRARILELFPERLQPPSRQQTVKFPQFVTRSGNLFLQGIDSFHAPLNLFPVSGDACRAAGLGSRQWCGRATHERTLIDSLLCRLPPGHCAERPLGRTLSSPLVPMLRVETHVPKVPPRRSCSVYAHALSPKDSHVPKNPQPPPLLLLSPWERPGEGLAIPPRIL